MKPVAALAVGGWLLGNVIKISDIDKNLQRSEMCMLVAELLTDLVYLVVKITLPVVDAHITHEKCFQ